MMPLGYLVDVQEALRKQRDEDILKACQTGACEHEWRLYEGFTERFDYCVKCDVKGTSVI